MTEMPDTADPGLDAPFAQFLEQAGVGYLHVTMGRLSGTGPEASATSTRSTSASSVGFRVFGGGELTFASVTRFGLSAELGYRSSSTPHTTAHKTTIRIVERSCRLVSCGGRTIRPRATST
jgi:hypothetical protein